jgi:hypothetical protein
MGQDIASVGSACTEEGRPPEDGPRDAAARARAHHDTEIFNLTAAPVLQ